MPFQSEKQRRYLWANEPEIARDWTDTYGSGIAKALGGRIPFGSGGNYDWSSEDNPELLQKMNDAVDKAVNDYLGKIKSGEISFPDNLQLEIDKVGNKTRHEMIQSEGITSDPTGTQNLGVLHPDPETGARILSNQEKKDKRLKELMDQTRLSNEEWLEQADARQLTAESPLFMRDFSYDITAPQTTREPMGDEMWPTPNEGLASIGPHGWEYGNQWQTAEEEDEGNWFNTIRNWASPIYNTYKENLLGMAAGIPGLALSMFGGGNRGPVINPSTQRFMQNYNVGRDPQTGRMVGGPFAGRNLPGTSMFGSKTPQEMAQNWMKKHGSRQYNTERQIAKQKEIRDIAAGNTNLPPGQKTFTSTGNGGGGGGNAGGAQLGSGMTTGQHAAFRSAEGGLAGLWQR